MRVKWWKPETARLRLWIRWILVGAVFVFGGVLFWARHVHGLDQQLDAVEELLLRGQIGQARVLLDEYLEGRPHSRRGVELLATALQGSSSEDEIDVRQQLFDAMPTLERLTLLVDACLRNGRNDSAISILEKAEGAVPEPERLVLVQAVAIDGGDVELALNALEARFDLGLSQDDEQRVNWALLKAALPDGRTAALEALESITSDSPVYGKAVQARLRLTRIERGDRSHETLLREVMLLPESTYAERMAGLEGFLLESSEAGRTAFFELLESGVLNPVELANLMVWADGQGFWGWVDETLERLPANVLAQEPLCWVAVAHRWKQMGEVFGAGEITLPVFENLAGSRHGWVLRRKWATLEGAGALEDAAFARDFAESPSELWENREANARLWTFARTYEMLDALESVLWEFARSGHGSNLDALAFLFGIYQERQDARGLYRVSLRQMVLDPRSVVARNNVILLGMLLEDNLPRQFRMADSLWESGARRSDALTSTYAYSLYLRGRTAEALQVFQERPAPQDDPSSALYYALVLAANGAEAEARSILNTLDLSVVLPEEKSLVFDLM